MRAGWIATLPLAAGVLHAVAAFAGHGGVETAWALRVAWTAFAAGGCVAAAGAFRPGERPWAGWALLAASFAVPLAYRLGVGPHGAGPLTRVPGLAAIELAASLATNGSAVGGAFLFARAFAAAGLAFSVPRGQRRAGAAVFLAVALALGVPVLLVEVRDALAQGARSAALLGAISSLGDLVCFALVGTLARIALELRGGTLQWTWALLAVSNLGYLSYDAAAAVAARAPAGDGRWALAVDAIYAVACVASGAAGLAHRRALRAAPAPRPEAEAPLGPGAAG